VNKLSTEGIVRVITNYRRTRTFSKPNAITNYIASLTPEQHKAVILGFAQQTVDLEDRIEELEGDLEYTAKELNSWKERSRPNLRRDAFLKKMDAAAAAEAEAEKKISEAQTEVRLLLPATPHRS
jgi:hypothetical protein